MTEKFEYDTGLGEGRNKIFEVRKIYNDITFIEEFLTAEFCSRHKLFVFDYNKKRERWEIMSREFEKIKQALLQNLTNAGSPFIYVLDGNFENRGELLLSHRFEGTGLQMDHARETMRNIHAVWARPVNLMTIDQENLIIIKFNGQEFSQVEMAGPKPDSAE